MTDLRINDEVRQFLVDNNLPIQYNDGLLSYLRDFYNVTHSSLPDLLARYIRENGYELTPAVAFSTDFTLGTLPAEYTFTRSGTATYVNSSGNIVSASSNTPRFTYDPATLSARGLLLEASSTNNVQRSRELDNAYWSQSELTVVANNTTSPDGTSNAERLVESVATSAHQLIRTSVYSVTSGDFVSTSIFVKAGSSGRHAKLTIAGPSHPLNGNATINLTNGSVDSAGGDLVEAYSEDYGNGWYRLIIVTQASATGNVNLFIRMSDSTNASLTSYAGNGSSFIYAWGVQMESARYASSFIPTIGSSASRLTDNLSITGANFSGFYNPTEGTLIVEGQNIYNYTGTYISVDDGGSSNFMSISRGNFNSSAYIIGPSSQMNTTLGSNFGSTVFKAALAYKQNDSQGAFNGSTTATDTSCNIPTVNQIRFRSPTSNNFYLRGFSYHASRKTNLDVLTS